MILDKSKRFLIVGLGLIGGSYAKGLKKYGFTVNAIEKEQASIDYALEKGIIDAGWTEANAEILQNTDVIIFSLYPKIFLEWIEQNASLLRKGTLITDVTGV